MVIDLPYVGKLFFNISYRNVIEAICHVNKSFKACLVACLERRATPHISRRRCGGRIGRHTLGAVCGVAPSAGNQTDL
jgi:hypothetical protein